MVVIIMSTKQHKSYDKIIDGYLCTFDPASHLCTSVMLATGMDIENWKKFSKKIVGTIDPKFNKKVK